MKHCFSNNVTRLIFMFYIQFMNSYRNNLTSLSWSIHINWYLHIEFKELLILSSKLSFQIKFLLLYDIYYQNRKDNIKCIYTFERLHKILQYVVTFLSSYRECFIERYDATSECENFLHTHTTRQIHIHIYAFTCIHLHIYTSQNLCRDDII